MPKTVSSAAKRAHQPKRPKHVPLRTCVACRRTRPKRELLRIVRTPQGHVELDGTGKKNGRGAYLCAMRSCWELALKKKRLEHELEIAIDPADLASLESYMASLPPDPAPAADQATP